MIKFIKHKIKSSFINKVCQLVRLDCRASLAMTVLFGVSFIFFLTACDGKKEEVVNGKPVVKIGVSLPLTGEAAYVGQPSKIAAQLALDEWKKKDTRFNYELVFENDQYSIRNATVVANKMISVDKVKAMVSIWDIAGPINMLLAKQHNIVHLTCAWGNDMSDGVNNFNNVSSHKEHANKMLDLLKMNKVSKLGYVYQVAKGDIGLKDTMIELFKDNGIEITYEEGFHVGDKDFRTFFAKIREKPVDYMIVTMIPEDFNVFVKQKREAGNFTSMTTVDYFESISNKEIVEGASYVISAPGKLEFIEKMKAYTDVIGQCIANVNVNIDLLITAFENAKTKEGGVPKTEEVVEVLHKMKKHNTSLGIVNVKDNGHIESEALLKKIENGKSVDFFNHRYSKVD